MAAVKRNKRQKARQKVCVISREGAPAKKQDVLSGLRNALQQENQELRTVKFFYNGSATVVTDPAKKHEAGLWACADE